MAPRVHTYPSSDSISHAAKSRRIKTTPASTESLDITSLRTRIWCTIINRLQDAGVPVRDVRMAQLDFVLPEKAAHAHLWHKLTSTPMSVTDNELQIIFSTEVSDARSSKPAPGTQIYYIRSFELKVGQLKEIVKRWDDSNIHTAECKVWKESLNVVRDDTVFIRYAGTSAAVSAYSRATIDLKRRPGGLYGSFIEALREHAPEAITNCQVYTFTRGVSEALSNADGDLFELDVTHTDIREQALIAIFDRRLMLNRHPGGTAVSYQPNDDDIVRFQRLNTETFQKLLNKERYKYQGPTDDVVDFIRRWADKLCAFGMAHPEEFGTDAVPHTEDHRDAWAEQATPCTFFGRVVLLMVGDYVPLHALNHPAAYWKQWCCRSVEYLKATYARLKAYEEGRESWNRGEIESLINSCMLPWVDLQYTPLRAERFLESAELLRQYVDEIKPLIVLSFEKHTSNILRTNFKARYYQHDFLPDVGKPEIQYFTYRGKVQGAEAEFATQSEDCYIQMPSFHPGADLYEGGAIEFRRVFDMTIQQVILMEDCALDALNERLNCSRLQLLENILSRFRNRWGSSPSEAAFKEAKSKLTQLWRKKKTRWSQEEERTYCTDLEGRRIAGNVDGRCMFYWQNPDGERIIAAIKGGRHGNVTAKAGATGHDAIRTVHFLPTGIDIRDGSGMSMTYNTALGRTHTAPVFPGSEIRFKSIDGEAGVQDTIKLWEHQTALNFDHLFPPDGPLVNSTRCGNCCEEITATRRCSIVRPCKRCINNGLQCEAPRNDPNKPPRNKGKSGSKKRAAPTSAGSATSDTKTKKAREAAPPLKRRKTTTSE